jgi:hypothetical protein
LSGDLQTVLQTTASETISRRQAARFLISATAAGFVLPAALSADNPVWHHIAHAALHDSAEAQLAAANWKPVFLNAPQEESLRSLAEVILPGSTKALVGRFIDRLLSVERDVAQKKFLGSLGAIEAESSSKFGTPFAKLSPQHQNTLLTAISSETRSGDSASVMGGHFENLKEWIVGAYYSSEIGMRELGWTPDRVFASFPSCTHAEGHS